MAAFSLALALERLKIEPPRSGQHKHVSAYLTTLDVHRLRRMEETRLAVQDYIRRSGVELSPTLRPYFEPLRPPIEVARPQWLLALLDPCMREALVNALSEDATHRLGRGQTRLVVRLHIWWSLLRANWAAIRR